MACKRITISGKVQGVFFRASTKDKAEELGLAGEVRNLADGRVEVLVCGDEVRVQQLVNWCHAGPSRAKVDEVIVNDAPEQRFDGFKIVRGR